MVNIAHIPKSYLILLDHRRKILTKHLLVHIIKTTSIGVKVRHLRNGRHIPGKEGISVDVMVRVVEQVRVACCRDTLAEIRDVCVG